MRILKSMLIAIMLLFAPVYAFSSELGYMRISLIDGDVQINTPDSEDWGLASVNGPLAEGDKIWTPQGSRAEFQLNNGTYIRLDQDSALQVLSMDKDSSQFYLSQGRAYVYYNAPVGSVMQIDTPDASVRAFNRAIFSIDISGQYTDVAAFKGYVKTENNAGETRINAGNMLSLGQNSYGELAPLGSADEWEDWNNGRDRKIYARRDGGSRYLPVELRPYSSDLDENGRWVQVPDYGYVWSPSVSVGVGWAPYRAGRWIWRGGDYVWVAQEPWGWAPYHYGRWAFVGSHGWCWVPPVAGDVYWSPGYVGWVRTPEYVAWVPLAPGERYYGRGNYGRNSVNISKENNSQVNITKYVYKNVYINNGVTVVNGNSFNTGSPTYVNVNRNIIQQKIFVRNNFTAGAPRIKPERGSYFASNRTVPQAKLPPQPVRRLKMGEIKSSRPFTREPDRSVLNAGAKARALRVTTVEKPRTPGRERPTLRNMPPATKGGPVMPAGTTPRGETPQAKPMERVKPGMPGGATPKIERPQAQPLERRESGAPGGFVPRGERKPNQPMERAKPLAPGGTTPKVVMPQPQPMERVKPVIPGGATPRIESPQTQPTEKREPVAPGGFGPRGERRPVQTIERAKPVAPAVVAPKIERPQPQPVERVKPVIPGGTAPKIERPQIQPLEKKEFGVPGGFGPRGERKPVQTIERAKPVAPAVVAPKIERPQPQPMERVKPVIPGGTAPKIERTQIQPLEKKEFGVPGGYAPRGERKPVQPIERAKSVAPAVVAPKIDRPQPQPVERAKPVAPGGAAQKIKKPKLKPGENVEPPADQKTERPEQRR